jgi:L-fucose mutarotase
MLKGIPDILSPALLKTLDEMGHGDEIVLADANFPAESMSSGICIRADGHGIPALLDAVLGLMPLDPYVDEPFLLMQVVPGDPVGDPPVWETYRHLLDTHAPGVRTCALERFAFYDRAREAYAIVATGERALYANVILKKGVL